MTTLYLIRHGEAAGNAAGRFLGQQDVPLTDEGRRQAARLAEELGAIPLAAVYSSDLRRAMETARPLAVACGLPVVTVPALREADFGVWTNLTYAEVAAGWPEQAAAWLADPERVAPPGGESMSTLRARALSALEAIVALRTGNAVVIVTHGGVLGSLMLSWIGPNAWQTPLKNGGCLCVCRTDEGWRISRDLTRTAKPGRVEATHP